MTVAIGNMRYLTTWLARGSMLAAPLLLPACLPFSFPERAMIGSYLKKGVPEFVVAGKTTRTDVRASLGKPDGMAGDDSWYSYGHVHNKGGGGVATYGVSVVALGTITVDYGRLIVYFDNAGLVETAHFEEKSCSYISSPNGDPQGSPCLDLRGSDLPRVRGSGK